MALCFGSPSYNNSIGPFIGLWCVLLLLSGAFLTLYWWRMNQLARTAEWEAAKDVAETMALYVQGRMTGDEANGYVARRLCAHQLQGGHRGDSDNGPDIEATEQNLAEAHDGNEEPPRLEGGQQGTEKMFSAS